MQSIGTSILGFLAGSSQAHEDYQPHCDYLFSRWHVLGSVYCFNKRDQQRDFMTKTNAERLAMGLLLLSAFGMTIALGLLYRAVTG
jgi:hypothetical protein